MGRKLVAVFGESVRVGVGVRVGVVECPLICKRASGMYTMKLAARDVVVERGRVQREPSGHCAALRQHSDGHVERRRYNRRNLLSDRHRTADQTQGQFSSSLTVLNTFYRRRCRSSAKVGNVSLNREPAIRE